MPRHTRQERYELLLHEPYNVTNPHPSAQTIYKYPLTDGQVGLILCFSALPTISYLLYNTVIEQPFSLHGFLVALSSINMTMIFLSIISPSFGSYKRRLVETPHGLDSIYVHRPFIGRRRCETKLGVTGGYSHSQAWFFVWRYNVRYEKAHWEINW